MFFCEQAVLKYTNNLQYCFACPPEATGGAPGWYSRRVNTIRQKGSAWTCVTNFWILIISIHTSRFGNRIKQIWQELLFINGYLRMEYTLFQDFARKMPRPAPPTGHLGCAQSDRTPEFGYGPLIPRSDQYSWLQQHCTNRNSRSF